MGHPGKRQARREPPVLAVFLLSFDLAVQMPAPRFDVDMLLSLRRPTSRVPMHLSPDGALLALTSQSKRRAAVATEQNDVTVRGIPIEALASRVHLVGTAGGEVQEPF